MIALAPPAAVVRGGAKKATEMTAMETMPAGEGVTATIPAAKSATTMAATKSAATVAATAATDQDQRAASCTQRLLLGAAEIARLCERGSCGKGQRKSADKTSRNETVPHDHTPFVTDQAGSTDRFDVRWSYPLCAATTNPAA